MTYLQNSKSKETKINEATELANKLKLKNEFLLSLSVLPYPIIGWYEGELEIKKDSLFVKKRLLNKKVIAKKK